MNNNSINIVRCVLFTTTFLAVPSNIFLIGTLIKHRNLCDTVYPYIVLATSVLMLFLSIMYAVVQPVLLLHDQVQYIVYVGMVLPEIYKFPLFFVFLFLKVFCYFISFVGFFYRYCIISRKMRPKSKKITFWLIIIVLITTSYNVLFFKTYKNAFDENDLDLLYYIRVVRSFTYSDLPVSSIYLTEFKVLPCVAMNAFRFAVVAISAIFHFLTQSKPLQVEHLSKRRATYNANLDRICTNTAVFVYCFLMGPYVILDILSLFRLNVRLFTLPFEALTSATTAIFPVICIVNVKIFRRMFINLSPFKKPNREQSISNK